MTFSAIYYWEVWLTQGIYNRCFELFLPVYLRGKYKKTQDSYLGSMLEKED
jgi:hypothetical protein